MESLEWLQLFANWQLSSDHFLTHTVPGPNQWCQQVCASVQVCANACHLQVYSNLPLCFCNLIVTLRRTFFQVYCIYLIHLATEGDSVPSECFPVFHPRAVRKEVHALVRKNEDVIATKLTRPMRQQLLLIQRSHPSASARFCSI